MFSAYEANRDTIVLDFGSVAPATFSGFVNVDEVPEYGKDQPLQLTSENRVEDDATALFRAFGLY